MNVGEMKLSVRAFNVLWYNVGDYKADFSPVEERTVRQLLAKQAGGERKVWRWLMARKNCGRTTAKEICERFHLPVPQYVGHCPTCTCRKDIK